MNPLDLRGPDFLLFYLGVALTTLALLWWFRRQAESGLQTGPVNLSDPYEIAYLRGGRDEAIRVAVLSLMKRGVLAMRNDKEIVTEGPAGARSLTHPLEKAVANFFSSPLEIRQLYKHVLVREAADRYKSGLAERGLLPDEGVRKQRLNRVACALLVLWGLGGAKIAIALARGRTNIWFLVPMMGVFTAAVFAVTFRQRTRAGSEAVAGVKKLFRQQQNPHEDAGAAELAMLAAVFGMGAVPLAAFPNRQVLFPQASSSGGSCGSSCGSSCGGSGCGSGGCGGCGGD
jgi:uncharacterized protein (TIGR04222 family)